MSSTLGTHFKLTSAGESHGPALVGIVDGCPAGLALSEADIQAEMDRRKPGQPGTSPRKESDTVQILSGVFEGKTTGHPIALLIPNEDAKSKDYDKLKEVFRPGHADYTYHKKYGIRDHRGGGRSSARLTALIVAAGAIAKKLLREQHGVEISGVLAVGLDAAKLEALKEAGDSIGGKVTVTAKGVPVGWGEPLFGKLDAQIAHGMLSINAVKAVEIGDGVNVATQLGSEGRDEMDGSGFLSNHNGGILGGISTGQDLVVHVSFKPTSSIRMPGKTVDIHGNETIVSTEGRHDPCVAMRAVPVVEAMMAMVLIDSALLVA